MAEKIEHEDIFVKDLKEKTDDLTLAAKKATKAIEDFQKAYENLNKVINPKK